MIPDSGAAGLYGLIGRVISRRFPNVSRPWLNGSRKRSNHFTRAL